MVLTSEIGLKLDSVQILIGKQITLGVQLTDATSNLSKMAACQRLIIGQN